MNCYRFSVLFIYFILQPHLIAWFSIGGTRLSLSLSRFPVSAPAAPGPGPHGGHRALALASLNWSLSLGVCHRHRPRAQTLPNCGHYGQPVNVVSASLLLTTPPNSGVQSAAVNVIIIICVSYSWPRQPFDLSVINNFMAYWRTINVCWVGSCPAVHSGSIMGSCGHRR